MWVATSHGSTVGEAPAARLNWSRRGAVLPEGPEAKAPPPLPPPVVAPAQSSRPAAPLVPQWIPPPPSVPPPAAPLPPKAPPLKLLPGAGTRTPAPGSTVARAPPPPQPAGVVAAGGPRLADYRPDEVTFEMNGHLCTRCEPGHSHSARVSGLIMRKPGLVVTCTGPFQSWQLVESTGG